MAALACASFSLSCAASKAGTDASTLPGPLDAAPPDGAANPDSAAAVDATSMPDASPTTPDAGDCGQFSSATAHFICAKDGNSRGKCPLGQLIQEACPRGCLRTPSDQDSQCLGTTDTWSCPGSYGTQRALDGDYYITAFGCWVDAAGAVHTDPADNCIPSCLAEAKRSGLCMPGDTGPQCEERVTWYTADGARFGCLQRLRITNPANGKSVIGVALDFGPACSGEARVSKAVLDASGRIDRFLFGSDQGTVDRSLVHVVEVDDTTPLGPVP